MSRTKVNCFSYPEGYFLEKYREKFGRSPKQWTIESLHDLWIRSKKRSDKLHRDIWQYIEKIAETIPANDGKHIAYFNQNNTLRGYVIEWNESHKTYSTHTISVSEFKSRDERIDFFVSTELNFEMGEELFRLRKLESYLHHRVFQVFWEKVEDKLRAKFKNTRPRESFVLQISDKKYIIQTEDKYGDYKKFKLECELLNDDLVVI